MDDELKCSRGADHIVSVNVIPFHGQFFQLVCCDFGIAIQGLG